MQVYVSFSVGGWLATGMDMPEEERPVMLARKTESKRGV